MNTMTALTIIGETLEETTFKMLKANKDEFMANREEATAKYMKLAMELKNKARVYIMENIEDVARAIDFNLQKRGTSTAFNYNFDHCLLKFIDYNNALSSNPLYQFSNANLYTTCLIATNSSINKPDFENPTNNKLRIGENSAAKGTAKTQYSNFNDLLNQNRTGATDMGAYNWTLFN